MSRLPRSPRSRSPFPAARFLCGASGLIASTEDEVATVEVAAETAAAVPGVGL